MGNSYSYFLVPHKSLDFKGLVERGISITYPLGQLFHVGLERGALRIGFVRVGVDSQSECII